jgi:hypothetical protein
MPWEIITIDLITQLPESNNEEGHKCTAIIVVVDRLTKRAHFFAHNDNCTSADVAEILFNRVFTLHGLPKQIVSDRGTHFSSRVFKEFCQKLGIKSSMSTAYHPQTDGQTERVNQTLEQYLRIFSHHRQDNWATLLPTAEFAYNNAPNESTKLSPFFVEYGYNPRMAPGAYNVTNAPSLSDLFLERAEAQEQAKAGIALAADHATWYYDQERQPTPFKVGDLVLIRADEVKARMNKLSAKHLGPYEIIDVPGPVNFKLKLPPHSKVHPVFHASKLLPYYKDTIGDRNLPQPGPLESEGYDVYEVESILDSRVHRKKVQYLVHWKGYDTSYDTWEPVHNVRNAWELVKQFHQEHPEAVQPVSKFNADPVEDLYKR